MREDVAALHVDAAGADQLLADALQRLVLGVRDDGVDVADQQRLAAAGAVQAGDQILGVAGRGARDALDRRLVGQQRRADATRTRSRRARRREGEDTATSASSSRGARLPISAAASLIHGSIARRLT